jgi:hypothetical protein
LAKAIIAPCQPNIEEVLIDGDNALLFDAAEPQAFERALTRLCSDASLRDHVCAGAGATITRLGLTWHSNAQRVTQLAVRAGARESEILREKKREP